jgi:hypothetical protein
MTNADQYLALFSSLEMLLRKRARVNEDYIDFHQVINTLVGDRKDRVVQQYERELKSFGALRNAIAHNYSKEPLADPRLDTITNLEDIINKLTSPQLAAYMMATYWLAFYPKGPR